MILSLTNVKGGVGKTTTAVNLAAAFAGSDLKVLVVDLDPQGSASASFGVAKEDLRPSTFDVLLGGVPAREAIMETGLPGLDLLTGSMDLAEADLVLGRKHDPEKKLVQALRGVGRSYDFIIVDCPPGLSLLTLNALAASHAYILPVVPHDLSFQALDRFFEGMDSWRKIIHRRPQLLGILLTMVDYRTKVTEEIVRKIRRAYSGEVFRTSIPVNVRLALAPRHGMTIFEFERWSTGAQAYSRLGAEVIRRARARDLI
jgi:chromosome partitioning protein